MTSEKIKETSHYDLSETAWLKEIALQLAILNEKKPEPIITPQLNFQKRR